MTVYLGRWGECGAKHEEKLPRLHKSQGYEYPDICLDLVISKFEILLNFISLTISIYGLVGHPVQSCAIEAFPGSRQINATA